MCHHVKQELEGLTLAFTIKFNCFSGAKPVFEWVRCDMYKQRTFRSRLDCALVHNGDHFGCLNK